MRSFPPPRVRTWIVAPWMFKRAPSADDTRAARRSIAIHPPSERDQVSIDGELSPELLSWTQSLGLELCRAPRQVAVGLGLVPGARSEHHAVSRAPRLTSFGTGHRAGAGDAASIGHPGSLRVTSVAVFLPVAPMNLSAPYLEK